MCDDYMQTAETAFYVKGQPRTYYAGSYFTDAKRFTQYDVAGPAIDDPSSSGVPCMSARAAGCGWRGVRARRAVAGCQSSCVTVNIQDVAGVVSREWLDKAGR
jgi:hypothetical protein